MIDIADVLEVTGAAHGNMTLYADDGEELLVPVIAAAAEIQVPGIGSGGGRFTDVRFGDWFQSAVTSMASGGVIQGHGNDKFNPNGTLTRAEAAQILYNYYSIVL